MVFASNGDEAPAAQATEFTETHAMRLYEALGRIIGRRFGAEVTAAKVSAAPNAGAVGQQAKEGGGAA